MAFLTSSPGLMSLEQLTAFELWLDHGSEFNKPPEQLPIVFQVRVMQLLFYFELPNVYLVRFLFNFTCFLNSSRASPYYFKPFHVLLSQCHRFHALVLLWYTNTNLHKRMKTYMLLCIKQGLKEHQFSQEFSKNVICLDNYEFCRITFFSHN